MSLQRINKELSAAYPVFTNFVPGLGELTTFRWLKRLWYLIGYSRHIHSKMKENTDLASATGHIIGFETIHMLSKPVKRFIQDKIDYVANTPLLAKMTYNRHWFDKPEQLDVIVVYHDAYKAGPHLDIHFSNGTSFIYKVKPHVYKELKYRNGSLTNESKALLINMIQSEIRNNSRLAQNYDHTISEANATWLKDEISPEGYGAGHTRQPILHTKAEIIRISGNTGQSAVIYIPEIESDYLTFIHHLYPGNQKRAPIVIWGIKKKNPSQISDKLHLKYIQDIDKFKDKVGKDGRFFIKYDGASVILVSDRYHTDAYSPRVSKTTNLRIPYTGKLPEIASITTPKETVVRGELLFERNGKTLTAAEIGGILNSHSVRSKDIKPVIRLYRVEKWNGKKIGYISSQENTRLLKTYTELSPVYQLPEEISYENILRKNKKIEGYVGVSGKSSINDGYKFKFDGNTNDWKVTKVDLHPGPTGRSAGVVWFKSLESGKQFKLGPGQIGSETIVTNIMKHPDNYIGQVYKVKSKTGHEGRASKIVEEHLDK